MKSFPRLRTFKDGFIFGLAAPVLLLTLLLGGCAHAPHPASVSSGECKVFQAPSYVVKGKKQYDQDWIDSTVEGGVGACGWQRPAARPAALDGAAVKQKPAAKAKKPTWLQMLHGLKRPVAAPAPAPVASEAPPTEPEPTPAPPPLAPAPLRPIDKLLGAGK